MEVSMLWWSGVVAVILAMLAIDLFVFHRDAHEVQAKEAAIWTAVWVAMGLGFAGVVAWQFGADYAGQYLAGYVIENSLAVDNIFVFAMIFAAFAIPAKYQHTVLFWGVMGALVFRAIFIAAGAVLLERFHWTIYVFGALLVVTAWKMWSHRHHVADPESSRIVMSLRRWLPMSGTLDGQRFFTTENGRRLATPLLAALVAVELADIVFAVDSIPAIFAVTSEPFLVFTSNAFAILGLRSMYFFLADMIRRFDYLSAGLALVLAFVGAKMLLIDVYKIPTGVSLAVVVSTIAISVVVSLHKTRGRVSEIPEAAVPSATHELDHRPDEAPTIPQR
jgi:tellurite resistance protein TerC